MAFSYEIDARKNLLVNRPSTDYNGNSFLYQHFATTGNNMGQYDLSVPIGANKYSTHSFNNKNFTTVTNTPWNLIFSRFSTPVANTAHGSLTKVGTWATSTTLSNAQFYETSAGRSNVDGDTITGAIVGSTLLVRYGAVTNGGFGVVSINGAGTLLNLCKKVSATDDFAEISRCDLSPTGAGLIRVTTKTPHHKITSSRIWIEGVLGCTEANGNWLITKINDQTFDLQASTYTNNYVGGGTVGFFKQADIGLGIVDCGNGGNAVGDEFLGLATDIPEDTYTVQVTVRNTTLLSTDTRVYITAFCGGTLATRMGDSTVTMGHYREVLNWRSNAGGVPTWSEETLAIAYNSTTFIGGVHGYEDGVASQWYVDGTPVTLSAGTYVQGEEISLIATSNLLDPADGTTVVCIKNFSIIGTSRTPMSLVYTCNLNWRANATLWDSYYGMMTAGVHQTYISTNSSAGLASQKFINQYFPYAFFDPHGLVTYDDVLGNGDTTIYPVNTVPNYAYPSNGTVGLAENKGDYGLLFSDQHDDVIVCYQPRIDKSMDDFERPFSGFWAQLRNDGNTKYYFQRSFNSGSSRETVWPGKSVDIVYGIRFTNIKDAYEKITSEIQEYYVP